MAACTRLSFYLIFMHNLKSILTSKLILLASILSGRLKCSEYCLTTHSEIFAKFFETQNPKNHLLVVLGDQIDDQLCQGYEEFRELRLNLTIPRSGTSAHAMRSVCLLPSPMVSLNIKI